MTYDAELDFYNSDGGRSSACGNGTRCVAYFISKEKNKEQIVFKTQSGILKSKILGNKIVETNIGVPKFGWKEIPLNKETNNTNLGITISDRRRNKFDRRICLECWKSSFNFFCK
jgi:diaminopimelate epimerase